MNQFFARLCFTALCIVSLQARAGVISGKAVFEGEAPVMKDIDMKADPVCTSKHSEPIKAEVLVLGEGQTMANVFVRVTKGLPEKQYPAPTEAFVVTQEGCRYAPHVFAVWKGQSVKFLNPDGTLHNVHGMSKVNKEFNKTMTKAMAESSIAFDQVEDMFPIRCQVHPWMGAYCAVVDNPYFSITALDGVYRIEGLDPGEYTVEAWHERLGTKTATVSVPAEGEAKADFTFARP